MFYLTPGGWLAALISVISLIATGLGKKWAWFIVSLIAVIGIIILGFSDFRLFRIG